MNKKRLFAFAIALHSFSLSAHYITYEFSGGRLGDNLIALGRAMYFAMRHNIELVVKDFPYSNKFKFHTSLRNIKSINPSRTLNINAERDLYNLPRGTRNLYVIPYFSEVVHERRLPWNRNWIHMDVNWEDQRFKAALRENLQPVENLNLIALPENCFSIAIHLRRGGNFDGKLQSEASSTGGRSEFCDTNVPMKFPPRAFYVNAIKGLLPHIAHDNVYIFLFTDDLNPRELCNYFKAQFEGYNKNIVFDARLNEANNETLNVLEDLFSMLKFDALIRPESSYSIIAGHLGNFKYEVYPLVQHWEGNTSCIEKIAINIKNN